MLEYIKNLFQLMLSPTRGWEDISAAMSSPDRVAKDGFYPMAGIAALSELVRLAYDSHVSLVSVVESGIALFVTYFVSFFIARMILESYLKPLVDGDPNAVKVGTFSLYALGLLVLIEFVENVVPTELTLIKFLPLFVALIIYKGSAYLSVKADYELRFLCLAVVALIVVPIGIFCMLKLLIS